MREPIRDIARLEHILEQIDNAREFAQNRSYDDLENDKLFRFAIVKCLEIIGEAAFMLTPEFKTKHPATPWEDIVHLRHVLVHGYYNIRMPIVWDIIQNDLPPLRPQIEAYIKEFA